MVLVKKEILLSQTPEPQIFFDDTKRGVSVVIPVFNGQQSLEKLVGALHDVVEAEQIPFEIILINDGSPDGSWSVITRLVEKHKNVTGINLMRNYGQHNALLCGIRAAGFEVVITMDDDLQHPPTEIPRLLRKLSEGYDVVYGTPQQKQHNFWRRLGATAIRLALRTVMGIEAARNVSAFRALRTDLRRAFTDYRSPYISIDVLLSWATTRFTSVRVVHHPRRVGVSNYSFRRLMIEAINMATGFGTRPLQMASWIGFLFTVFGLAVLLYVVGRFLVEGGSVPGFPFLASIIAIFSGAQLFALGIIGEYLSRMHFRMMDRPNYTVREVLRRNRDELD